MTAIFAFGLPFGWEWLIILAVVLLLFGNRIPGMARSLGSGIVEFKKGLRGGDEKKPEDGEASAPSKDQGSGSNS